jgi:hypothetical protein
MCKEEWLSVQITAIEAIEAARGYYVNPVMWYARGWVLHSIAQMQVGAHTNTRNIAKFYIHMPLHLI